MIRANNVFVAVAVVWIATAIMGASYGHVQDWIGWSVGATFFIMYFGTHD